MGSGTQKRLNCTMYSFRNNCKPFLCFGSSTIPPWKRILCLGSFILQLSPCHFFRKNTFHFLLQRSPSITRGRPFLYLSNLKSLVTVIPAICKWGVSEVYYFWSSCNYSTRNTSICLLSRLSFILINLFE